MSNKITLELSFQEFYRIVTNDNSYINRIDPLLLSKEEWERLARSNDEFLSKVPEIYKDKQFYLNYILNNKYTPVAKLKKIVSKYPYEDIIEAAINNNYNFVRHLSKKQSSYKLSAIYISNTCYVPDPDNKYWVNRKDEVIKSLSKQIKSLKYFNDDKLYLELVKLNAKYFNYIVNPSKELVDLYKVITL